jgi:endonuclease YncB( thermonuclease family)
MKQKFLNIFTIIFLGIFFSVTFDVAASKPIKSKLPLKSNIKFDKELSGKAFAIDGDSLKVGDKEVRLFGLDAPEYSQTCFDSKKQEYPCGQISREFLIKLVGKKEVKCLYAQMDKYNRFLSKCFIDKVSINEEIVKNGMAVIYNFAESEEKMNILEAEAKKQKIGIWRGAFQLPKEYRKEHPRTKK